MPLKLARSGKKHSTHLRILKAHLLSTGGDFINMCIISFIFIEYSAILNKGMMTLLMSKSSNITVVIMVQIMMTHKYQID